MTEQAKFVFLITVALTFAMLFGIEVGRFEAEQAASRRRVARYLNENFRQVEPGIYAPRESNAPPDGGPEG
jgi:hypothetical protein